MICSRCISINRNATGNSGIFSIDNFSKIKILSNNYSKGFFGDYDWWECRGSNPGPSP